MSTPLSHTNPPTVEYVFQGPSDSEGAVDKICLRDGEILYGQYFADTAAAYEYLISSRGCVISDIEPKDPVEVTAARARTERHTISRRTFHLVAGDAVDHHELGNGQGSMGAQVAFTLTESKDVIKITPRRH